MHVLNGVLMKEGIRCMYYHGYFVNVAVNYICGTSIHVLSAFPKAVYLIYLCPAFFPPNPEKFTK